MGVVYEATQLSLDRTVALKLLATNLGEDDAFRERFRREGLLQAAIEHPNIVTVYEAGESEHGLFMAMRLVRGPNLKDMILSRELDAGRTLRILRPIADGARHRARGRPDPPRHQAAEHPGRRPRPRLPGGLRPDQGGGREGPDQDRAVRRHARLHLARADPRPDRDRRQRHLRARGRALRVPDRRRALPEGLRGGGPLRAHVRRAAERHARARPELPAGARRRSSAAAMAKEPGDRPRDRQRAAGRAPSAPSTRARARRSSRPARSSRPRRPASAAPRSTSTRATRGRRTPTSCAPSWAASLRRRPGQQPDDTAHRRASTAPRSRAAAGPRRPRRRDRQRATQLGAGRRGRHGVAAAHAADTPTGGTAVPAGREARQPRRCIGGIAVAARWRWRSSASWSAAAAAAARRSPRARAPRSPARSRSPTRAAGSASDDGARRCPASSSPTRSPSARQGQPDNRLVTGLVDASGADAAARRVRQGAGRRPRAHRHRAARRPAGLPLPQPRPGRLQPGADAVRGARPTRASPRSPAGRPGPGRARFMPECERAASTLELEGAKPYDLGAGQRVRRRLNGTLEQAADAARDARLAALKAAKTPAQQARAAGNIAARLRRRGARR